ncbi:unnamed protein product [Trifolium pratense]|uniref:Uncharacterized protein n=1 Tax=Trifolium pratense TaxID=57577 RepID=A0ACB0J1I9_TRIPR|nr:unnamed protein product [Trifolium pratense]
MNRSSKMKGKVYDFYPMDFNRDEHEVADILLHMPMLHIVIEKRKNVKITLGGKRISKIREEIDNNNNVHAMLQNNIPDVVMENNVVHAMPQINTPDVRAMSQINILDVVMENVNNTLDIPMIPGVPNNNIFQCCKPFEKKLSNSDLRVDYNRLFMTKSHVEDYFLPFLRECEENIEDGIHVVAYDMQGRTFNMTFKIWTNKFYVLTGSGWKNFFKQHSLQANQDHVKVWMFRHSQTNKICFALSIRRE